MAWRLLALLVTLGTLAVPGPAAGQNPPDSIDLLVARLEQLALVGDRAGILALAARDAASAGLEEFAANFSPAAARVVIKERDRTPVEGGIQRLLLEVFVERGMEGRVATWRGDLVEDPSAGGKEWRLARMERLTVVSGLYRLALDTTRQYDVRNLTLNAPDLTLHLASGTAFVAATPEGPTAIVLLGRGQMRFAPPDKAEQTQLRIFAGATAFDSEFDAAFIRVRPSEFAARFRSESLIARDAASGNSERAQGIFDEYVGRTLQIDLTDLSRDRWSLVPNSSDFIAEVRTRRYGSLTYARAWGDAEDVSLFDRRRRRNISVYASAEKLAARGRFYSEDDLVDYDITHYEIDAAFAPDRRWISGNARLTLKVRAPLLTTMTLKLAETLTVRGVYMPGAGRLLHLRVVGQNNVIVNLPALAPRDTELQLLVLYSGRIDPQELDREALSLGERQDQEPIIIPLEPRFIYSNRSYWYPQATVTDYATAKLRITVPAEYEVIASGTQAGPPAAAPGPVDPGARAPRVFVFDSTRPARYFGCVISRFATVTTAELTLRSPEPNGDGAGHDDPGATGDGPPARAIAADDTMTLVVQANPRQTGRARALGQRAAAIIEFYASLLGEAPYPGFTLAVTESDLPGGHSPPYFAVLNQPLPTSPFVWRNDPVAFDSFPTFFLAHELAHQWWGQAIGWKNYHEQWISEGFAQYFAAMYAERERGPGGMQPVIRQMRKWAVDLSEQGPVYLGYRLGHIRGDGRVFRALIYNKAAMVLHMLRRLVGDEPFFAGVRKFYTEWRFKKAGTDDFRVAMEEATRRNLTPFFEAWIYGSEVPRLRYSTKQSAEGLTVRFEHRGEVMPVPVTVTITYASGRTEEVIVPVLERVVERTLPLKEAFRKVEVNQDAAAVAEFEK